MKFLHESLSIVVCVGRTATPVNDLLDGEIDSETLYLEQSRRASRLSMIQTQCRTYIEDDTMLQILFVDSSNCDFVYLISALR